jgi:hypothetical protein
LISALARGPRRAVVLVLLAVALAGCTSGTDQTDASTSGSTTTATAEAVAELGRRVAAANDPYSATVTSQLLLDGAESSLLTGQANLNAPYTGRNQVRYPASGDQPVMILEYLTTEKSTYTRQFEETDPEQASRWASTAKYDESPVGDLKGYAELLLSHGPAAVQGTDPQDGGPATHLSAALTPAEIRALEPAFSERLVSKEVASIDCDVWVNDQGHVVRLEQEIKIDGEVTKSIVTLSKFGAPFKQKAPAA